MIKGAQSVYRTLNILKLIIRRGDRKVGAREISEALDIPSSTVHRLLSVLRECGFVSLDAEAKKYHVGKECVIHTRFDREHYIRSRYAELARQVAERFGHTTFLYARRGYDCICVDRVEGTHTIQVFTCRPGDVRPLGLGSGTLAMLAFQEADEIEGVLAHNGPSLVERTLVGMEEIRNFIDISRERGYGYAHGMAIENTVGISLPIRMEGEVIGSLAVDSLKDREWEANLPDMVAFIRDNM